MYYNNSTKHTITTGYHYGTTILNISRLILGSRMKSRTVPSMEGLPIIRRSPQ